MNRIRTPEELEELRQALGLDASVRIELQDRVPMTEGLTGQGACPALDTPAVDMIPSLLEQGALHHWTGVEQQTGDVQVWCSPVSGLAVMGPLSAVEPRQGTWEVHEDVVYCDFRAEKGRALIWTNEGQKIVEFADHHSDIYSVEFPASDAMRQLAAMTPEHREIELPAMDVEALLDGRKTDEWLRAEAVPLQQSDHPLDRLAAAGLLARLWIPLSVTDKEALLTGFLKGEAHPVQQRVRDYAATLEAADVRTLDGLAATAALDLMASIDSIAQAAAGHGSSVAEDATAVCVRRDDLESVLFVLRAAGSGEKLAAALSVFDRVALEAVDALDDAMTSAHPRLASLGFRDPAAWWSR